jgi:hypothetical protein
MLNVLLVKFDVFSFLFCYSLNLGWWPMLAPVKPGVIRDKDLLGVSLNNVRK